MRRAAAVGLALLVCMGAVLLLYRALSNFLLAPAKIDRSPSLATESRNQEGAPALAGAPPANPHPHSLEDKQ